MIKAVRSFGASLSGGAAGLFFYFGYAVFNGTNHLVLVVETIESADDIELAGST